MKHFANRLCIVSMLLKELWKCSEVTTKITPVAVEVIEAQCVWSSTGQERVATWSTQSLLIQISNISWSAHDLLNTLFYGPYVKLWTLIFSVCPLYPFAQEQLWDDNKLCEVGDFRPLFALLPAYTHHQYSAISPKNDQTRTSKVSFPPTPNCSIQSTY